MTIQPFLEFLVCSWVHSLFQWFCNLFLCILPLRFRSLYPNHLSRFYSSHSYCKVITIEFLSVTACRSSPSHSLWAIPISGIVVISMLEFVAWWLIETFINGTLKSSWIVVLEMYQGACTNFMNAFKLFNCLVTWNSAKVPLRMRVSVSVLLYGISLFSDHEIFCLLSSSFP